MNSYCPSELGIIITDMDRRIAGCNKTAQLMLKSVDLIGNEIDDVLQDINMDFTVEEANISNRNIDPANKAYILRPAGRDCDDDDGDAFYKTILEASHDEIFVTDGEGITLYCNKAFERNYGMMRAEILGKSVWHLAENGYATESPIPVVLDQKKQITIDQKTSTGRKLVITATPVFDAHGEIRMVVENCRDITDIESIKSSLEKTEEQVRLYKTELKALRNKELDMEEKLIVRNGKLQSIIDIIHRVSNIDPTILLLGESGTGKSAIAKYIHKNSSRKDGPFITINCATIPSQLFESELFGYEAGAFTGASKKGKLGLVELADEGTLFLDEVGEIPLSLQPKLLQLIQEHTFLPVGAVKPKSIDVRIISATNKNLGGLVADNLFREDLYYRLKVIELNVPPLRERKEDMLDLISSFLKRYNDKYSLDCELSMESKELLNKYHWPGNIRELQNVIEQIVITAPNKVISPVDLPVYIFTRFLGGTDSKSTEQHKLDEKLSEVEKTIIQQAWSEFGSSYKVAKALGISQSRASRLIRKYHC